jgi:hypothetical protein
MFEWDKEKNRTNRLKRDVSFETAALVFDDPYALTQPDPISEEERFTTLDAVGPGSSIVRRSCEPSDRGRRTGDSNHFRPVRNRPREEEL